MFDFGKSLTSKKIVLLSFYYIEVLSLIFFFSDIVVFNISVRLVFISDRDAIFNNSDREEDWLDNIR